MTMNSEGPLKLRVVLDAPDLLEYGLTFNQLDYSAQRTRKLLNALLIKAAGTTDFHLCPGKLMIEAFPQEGGGCVIYFTIKQHRKFWQKKENVHQLFSFSDASRLLDAAKAAYISHAHCRESKLYKADGLWLLDVLGAENSLTALLCEYADSKQTAKQELYRIAEYGKFICADAINAIGTAILSN